MQTQTRIGATTFEQPSDTQLVATRVFDASREMVWAAHTQCRHLQHWQLGPEGWSMPQCEVDVRPGGQYRYVYAGPDGAGFQFSGEYREVHEPDLLVNTEMLDDGPTRTLNTLTLTEQPDGRTLLRVEVEYPSRYVREEVIATGMLEGWAESYDVLEEYLDSLR